MCNLYRMTQAVGEVAKWFDAVNEVVGANFGPEVYPGNPGAVIAGGALRQMTWGFPLVLNSKRTGEALKPKPVNNARADKLDSYMWRYSFAERRCLIPLTAWAEAQGPRGGKTRTWLSLPNADLFTVAGIWRESSEWGDCYSMIMTDAAGAAAEVHSRMPVILSPETRDQWQQGPLDEARQLLRSFDGALTIDRTSQSWGGK